jgi:hypothetical protein
MEEDEEWEEKDEEMEEKKKSHFGPYPCHMLLVQLMPTQHDTCLQKNVTLAFL